MALGIYANVYQLLPFERTTEFLRDVVGRQLSEGSLANKIAEFAKRITPTVRQIKQALKKVEVLRVDETGMRVQKALYWLHTMSTPTLTYYAIDKNRGRAAQERIDVLPEFGGVMVHGEL